MLQRLWPLVDSRHVTAADAVTLWTDYTDTQYRRDSGIDRRTAFTNEDIAATVQVLHAWWPIIFSSSYGQRSNSLLLLYFCRWLFRQICFADFANSHHHWLSLCVYVSMYVYASGLLFPGRYKSEEITYMKKNLFSVFNGVRYSTTRRHLIDNGTDWWCGTRRRKSWGTPGQGV